MVNEVTKETFKADVLEAQCPVFVDFYATWCAPCQMISPIIDELAEESDDVKFVKLDVDEAQETALEYGVMSIPTFILFDKGAEVTRMIGFHSKENLEEMLKKIK